MAFSNALNGRMEELRFPNVNMRPSENDGVFSATISNKRDSNPFYPTVGPSAPDVRGSLQRRFTTDSSKLSLGRSSFSQHYSSLNSSSVCDLISLFNELRSFAKSLFAISAQWVTSRFHDSCFWADDRSSHRRDTMQYYRYAIAHCLNFCFHSAPLAAIVVLTELYSSQSRSKYSRTSK